MRKYISSFLNLITFHHSYAIRVSVVIGYFMLFILIYTMLFGNPFTSENHTESVEDYYLIPTISEITENSNISYEIASLDEDLEYYIYKILNKDSVSVYDTDYENGVEADDDDELYRVRIDSLRNYDVHPLPFLTKSVSNNDIFIFGTNYYEQEVFNNIVFSFKNTFYLVLCSISGFLLFGLFLGIVNGYYKYHNFSKIFILIQKAIESVPLLLWVLVTVVTVNFIISANYHEYEWPIIYFLFGIFSSTALSKLVTEKIDSLRDKDFIVALKLLGLTDYTIVFNHIIRYYCFDIILFQLINIIAQSIYLNITLCIIEFHQNDTIGMMFNHAFANRYTTESFIDLIIISTLIYFVMSSLFYTARYLKAKNA